MEWNTTPRSIFASPILRYAFVRPCIFLLEIGDFKDGVWILHFDFAGERDTAGSPPAYFWDRARKEEQKVPMMVAVSPCDQNVINHRRKAVAAKALWIIVPYKANYDRSDFPELLKELWFLLPCLFM